MFAGKATWPYHLSTIHGTFESRTQEQEVYQLDLALEPILMYGISFDELHLYQPTFLVRCEQADPTSLLYKAPKTITTRNGAIYNVRANKW